MASDVLGDAAGGAVCDAVGVRPEPTVTAERMLAGITDAAERMRNMRYQESLAREDLRLIVKAAVGAGVPISKITKAAGWSQRASVYNLLRGK